jgi:hypothetical protein
VSSRLKPLDFSAPCRHKDVLGAAFCLNSAGRGPAP